MDQDSLKDGDSSASPIHCDSLCQCVGRRNRQRMEVKKIDGRKMKEHQKENKIFDEKTDEDTK